MFDFKKLLSTSGTPLKPIALPSWDKKLAVSQSPSDYITLSELLSFLNTRSIQRSWLDLTELNALLKISDRHRIKVEAQYAAYKICRTIFVTSLPITGLAALIHSFEASLFSSWVFGISGLVLFGSGVSMAVLSGRITSNRQMNHQKPLKELCIEEHLVNLMKYETAMKDLVEFEPTPYFLEADGKYRSTSKAFWKADFSELAAVLNKNERSCVTLEGETPSSELMFLKSEIEPLWEQIESSRPENEVEVEPDLEPEPEPEFELKPESEPKFEAGLESEPEPNIYEKLGLPKNTTWSPHIRAAYAKTSTMGLFVKHGNNLKKQGIYKDAFLGQLRAFRTLLLNKKLLNAMRLGELDDKTQLEIETELREALLPSDPGSADAQVLLKAFLGFTNRKFDKYVSTWGVIPQEEVQEQVKLYFKNKDKT